MKLYENKDEKNNYWVYPTAWKFRICEFNLMIDSLIPCNVIVKVTIDDNRMRTNFNNLLTSPIQEDPGIFFIKLPFLHHKKLYGFQRTHQWVHPKGVRNLFI